MTASTESVGAAPKTQRRVPDFFIVGHAKSGTTALYEMLGRHPEIFLPEVKEPYFFACENPQPKRDSGRRWSTLDQTGTRSESFAEYLSLFAAASPGQRIGEGSTHYLWSPTAAARIAEAQPSAKIIAILREPASFLRSLHLQLVQNGHETETSFRAAMALEDDRREGRRIPNHSTWPRCLFYSERVRYVEQLRRFHASFPREQVLVMIYDDFHRDNERAVREVLRFLDVDDTAPIDVITANPTVRVRSRRVRGIVRRLTAAQDPLSRAVHVTVKTLVPRALRRSVRQRVIFGAPKPAEEEFMTELRRRFKGEVVALSEYLDRDLVRLWGYDTLD
jgi:hypothetical protein